MKLAIRLFFFSLKRRLLGTKYHQGQQVWPNENPSTSLRLIAYKGARVTDLLQGRYIIEEEWVAQGPLPGDVSTSNRMALISVGHTWIAIPKTNWKP